MHAVLYLEVVNQGREWTQQKAVYRGRDYRSGGQSGHHHNPRREMIWLKSLTWRFYARAPSFCSRSKRTAAHCPQMVSSLPLICSSAFSFQAKWPKLSWRSVVQSIVMPCRCCRRQPRGQIWLAHVFWSDPHILFLKTATWFIKHGRLNTWAYFHPFPKSTKMKGKE